MLLVTGPVTRNMELALRKTYDAMPDPRLVVAVGACGCSGGIFGLNYATCGGGGRGDPGGRLHPRLPAQSARAAAWDFAGHRAVEPVCLESNGGAEIRTGAVPKPSSAAGLNDEHHP